ncbi:MAG: hypothetical protein ACNS62_20015 [Candidatus Cyclobacteriaceae bacterium M3_2C_046]
MRFYTFILVFFSILYSCNNGVKFEGFDDQVFRNDRNGCEGHRLSQVDQLKKLKSSLEGLSRNQVIQLLGRPDASELYRRGQIIYRYHLAPAPACPVSNADQYLVMEVWINALGIVSEINFKNYQEPSGTDQNVSIIQ